MNEARRYLNAAPINLNDRWTAANINVIAHAEPDDIRIVFCRPIIASAHPQIRKRSNMLRNAAGKGMALPSTSAARLDGSTPEPLWTASISISSGFLNASATKLASMDRTRGGNDEYIHVESACRKPPVPPKTFDASQ